MSIFVNVLWKKTVFHTFYKQMNAKRKFIYPIVSTKNEKAQFFNIHKIYLKCY